MAEAAREMTPEELFNKAMGHRRTMLSLNPKPGDDVPMLSLMADERAHRRADAKLDRLLGMVGASARSAAEFRGRCTIQADGGPDRRWRGSAYILGVFTGVLTGVLVMRLLGA